MLIVFLPSNRSYCTIGGVSEKRTKVISVRATPSEHTKMKDAAAILWPGAIMTDSAIALSLALLQVEAVLRSHNPET